MYKRHVVRNWQVIAEEVSKENHEERFTELLTELSEALDKQVRKLKAHVVPRVSNKITKFPAAPSR